MGFDKNCKRYYFLEKLAKAWEVEAKVFCRDKRIVFKNTFYFVLSNHFTLIWCTYFSHQSCDGDAIIAILKMRKMGLRDFNCLARNHTGRT